jgi:MoaA/NifB/PqqE/SkfB family radical SAM enzyme
MQKEPIKKVYIEPTSACNLNCKICFRNNWINEKNGVMSNDTVNSVYKSIHQLHDIKIVFAGMGEPLLHKRIVEMINRTSQHNKVEIITNATLLDEKLCCELIDAGISCIWISLDMSHIESANSLQVIENIRYFNNIRKGNCDLGLTYVLYNGDFESIKKMENVSKYLEADRINISQLIPCERIENLIYSTQIPIGERKLDNIYDVQELKLNYCPFIEDGCTFIKWNGDIVPCMQLLHSSYTYLFDEKRMIHGYNFGNINEEFLLDIWDGKAYSEFREKVKKFDFPDCTICDGCDDRKENKIDCMYNQIPTCGACLWAQNIARCP